ncbi:hypothetical protein COF68_31770 [Bacillus toyonensis]|uniref:hypothetical protein n=1 Tax=Bacillus toyonensis TaxID=155322 RepID=UPI000BFE4F19|nr:hypothetical protein [Bacillus toyonensis]PHE57034.1 hypothetical protein COF68_31770 [Bacillus toyonensis]
MKIGKKLVTGVLALSLSIGTFASSSFANEIDTPKNILKSLQDKKDYQIKDIKENYSDKKVQAKLIEKVNKGEILDNINPAKEKLGKKVKLNDSLTVTTYPDGSKELSGIDYSEAKFFDEKGNEVQPKSQDIKGITGPQGSISGGTWTSGSGYSCVQGAKVVRSKYSNFTASFKADFCYHQGAFDKISRIYSVLVDAPGGDYDTEGEGLFREWENASYSAYGGVKFKYTRLPDGGSSTQYLFLRVGGDRAWEDSNIVN